MIKKRLLNIYRRLIGSAGLIRDEASYRYALKGADFSNRDNNKFAVILHLYYADSWSTFSERIKSSLEGYEFDLYITMPKHNIKIVDVINSDFSQAKIIFVPNRGRDVLPFVRLIPFIKKAGYVYVLKLHSKKSTHRKDGKEWLDGMLTGLLPYSKYIMKNIHKTMQSKDTGVIGPSGVYYPLTVNFPANGYHMTNVLNRIYSKSIAHKYLQSERGGYGFFGGTMFWVRVDSIYKLCKFSIHNFESERGQIDGTFPHALERLFTLVSEIDKRNIFEVGTDGVVSRRYASTNIPEWSEDHLK